MRLWPTSFWEHSSCWSQRGSCGRFIIPCSPRSVHSDHVITQATPSAAHFGWPLDGCVIGLGSDGGRLAKHCSAMVRSCGGQKCGVGAALIDMITTGRSLTRVKRDARLLQPRWTSLGSVLRAARSTRQNSKRNAGLSLRREGLPSRRDVCRGESVNRPHRDACRQCPTHPPLGFCGQAKLAVWKAEALGWTQHDIQTGAAARRVAS